ncbi:hypothetical protein ACFLXZ_00615 [Chloroflexota bacterium]
MAVKDGKVKHGRQRECQHYWLIETADGPTSKGVCRFCGADREFYNWFPGMPVFSKVVGDVSPRDLSGDRVEIRRQASEREESDAGLLV